MIRTQDIMEMNQVSRMLAAGLAQNPDHSQLPLEVIQALESAKDQMDNIPEVIADLNMAAERFLTLSDALGRMNELARLAGNIEDEASVELRAELEEEFIGLAKVVAAEAGRVNYQGPHLSLRNQAEANSAQRILQYMDPVLDNMKHELEGQRGIISEVISETINFLGIIAQCYPKVAGLDHLNTLLEQVKGFNKNNESFYKPSNSIH